jgi:hypothetical protein
MLDDFRGLAFKAYLWARRDGGSTGARENLYAPFYLWDRYEAMTRFLCGDGFVGLTRDFGWPGIRTWIVWQAHLSQHLREAAFATREVRPIEPFTPLAELYRACGAQAVEDVERKGALAAVAGFEPTTWSRVRFRLWREQPAPADMSGAETYRVAHISWPARAAPPAAASH